MKIALIDNYDSFTRNISDLIYRVSGVQPYIYRNDELTYHEFDELNMDCTVLSPGPGHPGRSRDFGICADVLKRSEKPILGICLGHQGIGHVFGATVNHAPAPVHGRLATISHTGAGLFEGIPQRFKVVRYHSLCVRNRLPEDLQKIAWTDDELIMGLQHRRRSIFGVQFHPESICSEFGDTLIYNFIKTVTQ